MHCSSTPGVRPPQPEFLAGAVLCLPAPSPNSFTVDVDEGEGVAKGVDEDEDVQSGISESITPPSLRRLRGKRPELQVSLY